jgi:hypothetical protein
MRENGRSIRISWWVWVALLLVGLATGAAGIGWFVVVLVAISWLAVTLFNHATRAADEEPDSPPPPPRDLLAQPRGRLDAALSDAPSTVLCQLWEETGRDLRRTYLPSTVCSYAALREAILDELSRRHPDAVRRWLDDQPDRRDLSAYLQHHR